MKTLLAMSVLGGTLACVLRALSPLTRRKFTAGWHRSLSIAVLCAFLLPLPLVFTLPCPVSPHMAGNTAAADPAPDTMAFAADHVRKVREEVAEAVPVHIPVRDGLWRYLGALWLAGALAVCAGQAVKNLRFYRAVSRSSSPETQADRRALLRRVKGQLGITRPVLLYRCPLLQTPLLMGLLRPRVLLPQHDCDLSSLEMILLHELTHLRCGDLWLKLAGIAASTLHWFNPLAHLARRSLEEAQELACDERVMAAAPGALRRAYAAVILDASDPRRAVRGTATTVSFSASPKQLRRRLAAIVRPVHRNRAAGVLAAVVLAALCVTALPLSIAATNLFHKPQTATLPDTPPRQLTQQEVPADATEESWLDPALLAASHLSLEEAMEQRQAMDTWLNSLDRNLYGGLEYSGNDMIIQVTDQEAFQRSAAMAAARENGWVFTLREVEYSQAQIDAAIDLLLADWERFGLTALGPWPPINGITVGAEDLSEENLLAIAEYCGVANLEPQDATQIVEMPTRWNRDLVAALVSQQLRVEYDVHPDLIEPILQALAASDVEERIGAMEAELTAAGRMDENGYFINGEPLLDVVIHGDVLAGFLSGALPLNPTTVSALYDFAT